MKIIDERKTSEVKLENVEFGVEFLWNNFVCKRVKDDGHRINFNAVDMDNLPVFTLTAGQLTELPRDTWVEPIETELTIIE